jgi:sporulation protein YlmC with PRC-barrel domain
MTSLTLFEVALFPTNKSVFLQEILMFPDPNMLFCSMPKSQSVRIPWENVKKIAQLQN